jgi:hypothetical protein
MKEPQLRYYILESKSQSVEVEEWPIPELSKHRFLE